MNWKKRTMRYTEGFWLTGPEKVRAQEADKLMFKMALFAALAGTLLGWACRYQP